MKLNDLQLKIMKILYENFLQARERVYLHSVEELKNHDKAAIDNARRGLEQRGLIENHGNFRNGPSSITINSGVAFMEAEQKSPNINMSGSMFIGSNIASPCSNVTIESAQSFLKTLETELAAAKLPEKQKTNILNALNEWARHPMILEIIKRALNSLGF